MYCQTCGSALALQTKFCNRCGTQLATTNEKSIDKTPGEKRLDEYLDGLFWISVFGLAFIVGGVVLLKKVGFSDLVLLVYATLSSTVFLINFGISLWNSLRIMRSTDRTSTMLPERVETRELGPAMPLASVTENTTRSFEPVLTTRTEKTD